MILLILDYKKWKYTTIVVWESCVHISLNYTKWVAYCGNDLFTLKGILSLMDSLIKISSDSHGKCSIKCLNTNQNSILFCNIECVAGPQYDEHLTTNVLI